MMFDLSPSSALPGSSSNSFDLGGVSRKRSMDEQSSGEVKRPRWYYRLESESSRTSEEDTESMYSVQGYETELVQDTPDTETKSEDSSADADDKSDYDFEVEYEVASLSEDENPIAGEATSSGTDDMLAAAGAIAAVICDTSMEAWLTGGEDSDNSSVGEAELNRTDYWTCIQCKSRNNNPLYRYCQECFQVRKNRFPPRPRGHRKRRRMPNRKSKDEKVTKQAVSSQDSGIGSSQDLQRLELAMASTSSLSTVDTPKAKAVTAVRGRKRKHSTASESTETDVTEDSKRVKCEADSSLSDVDRTTAEIKCSVVENEKITKVEKSAEKPLSTLSEYQELCIICNDKAKNSIFLHGKIGHMCSCYECAMRCWQTHKRCPACNRKVNNVVRVFKV